MIEEKAEPCVWRTAIVAIVIFVAVMAVAGMFGNVESVAIASQ